MDLFIYKVNHWICSHQWYQEEAGNEEKEQQWSGRRGTHKSWQKEDQVGNLRAFGYRPVFSRGWRAGVTSAQKSKLNSTCSCLLLETSSHDYVGKKLKKQLALGHLGNMSPMPKGPILQTGAIIPLSHRPCLRHPRANSQWWWIIKFPDPIFQPVLC